MDSYQARFGGLGRLYGVKALDRLRHAHVCVIGVGGVGSWAVEALARSGVGELTLIDLDDVCISNTNRQLHALQGHLGQPKVEVLQNRILAIHPECRVHACRAFLTRLTADELLAPNFDYVLDAIDSPSKKCLTIARCRDRGVPVITVGASGGRRDPLRLRIVDLALSSHDRLLQEVRRQLRVRYGFPREGRPFGVECVCSSEPPVFPALDGSVCADRGSAPDLRLDCQSGFGTACFVTGAFGLAAASRIVARLAEGIDPHSNSPPTFATEGKGSDEEARENRSV